MAHLEADQFDYPSPPTLECPYPFYAAARRSSPVYRLPSGQYLVTRWQDVVDIAQRTDDFSNYVGPLIKGLHGGALAGAAADGETRYAPWALPFSDPPEHRVKKNLSLPIVSRERLHRLEPEIRALADELIDGFADRGGIDFKREFADRFAIRAVMTVLGAPREDEPRFLRWSNRQSVGLLFSEEGEAEAEAARRKESLDYFRELVLDRHAHPRADDFVSELVRAQVAQDGELESTYLTVEVTNFSSAGGPPTAHMISSAMWLLLQHPEQLHRVASDRSLIRPMLEETLRVESPIQWLPRVARHDTEIAGVAIPAGAVLLVAYAAANRDPAVFEDPDAFAIDRPNLVKQNLGFGRGIHLCLGAPLARLEGQIAFEQLFARLTNFRLAAGNDYAHVQHFMQRGLNALHIEFDAV